MLSRVGASGLLLWALLLGGCAGSRAGEGEPAAAGSPTQAGPILLITLLGLRADAAGFLGGGPGLTPNLDSLAAEADWAGAAIAPSSRSAPATASLLTGLLPSQHGVRRDGAALPVEVTTLAEALSDLGYETSAHLSSDWTRRVPGYRQGLDRIRALGLGRAAARELSALDCGRRLVWMELDVPTAPYRLYPALLPRLAPAGDDLPPRVGRGIVQRFRQRGELPSEAELRRWRALYASNVARADQRIGEAVDALRSSGCWDAATVVVVSARGEELGDYGSVAEGRSLRRALVEVPLVLKLPVGRGELVASTHRDATVGTVALWSTLVGLAGGRRPPAVAPGLQEGSVDGVLSELRGQGGVDQLSWVSERDQLVRVRGRRAAGERPTEVNTGWRWGGHGEEVRLLAPDRLAELADRMERERRLVSGGGEQPPPLVPGPPGGPGAEEPGAPARHGTSPTGTS